jgi:hypothetical protein
MVMGLTNDELAQAIEVADKKVHECSTGSPRHEPLLEHLKALLAEQRRRAVQERPPQIVAPLWVQPAWVPPWTITCGVAQ